MNALSKTLLLTGCLTAGFQTQAVVINGFTDSYDVSNWTLETTYEYGLFRPGEGEPNPPFDYNAPPPNFLRSAPILNSSDAPDSLTIVGADLGPDDGVSPDIIADTSFTITALGSGEVRYDWVAIDRDDNVGFGFGPFFLDDFIPGPTAVVTDGVDASGFPTRSGTAVFNVLAGDTFGVRLTSRDSFNGSVIATISNFSAPGATLVPVPSALLLMLGGLGGLLARQRLTSAETISTKLTPLVASGSKLLLSSETNNN